jgi:hypothetical protein
MNDPTPPLDDELLALTPTANVLRVSIFWLAKARLRGNGPRYVKIRHSVRYPKSYLGEYLRTRTPTSAQPTNNNRGISNNWVVRTALFAQAAFASCTKGGGP